MKRRQQTDMHFRFYLLSDLSIVYLPRDTCALDFQGFFIYLFFGFGGAVLEVVTSGTFDAKDRF